MKALLTLALAATLCLPALAAPAKRETSIQCAGIAKSTGLRCKVKTLNLNGYCHHHQAQAK
jgi:hypothetical protein